MFSLFIFKATRRLKTEFLVQLDGAGTDQDARVVVVGATNRPDELDEAARRRFVKRIYVPLPDVAGRNQLLRVLLRDADNGLQDEDIAMLVEKTAGYSGADIRALANEAAMGPMREIMTSCKMMDITIEQMPEIRFEHFIDALELVAPSVSQCDLVKYVEWNSQFGTYRNKME